MATNMSETNGSALWHNHALLVCQDIANEQRLAKTWMPMPGQPADGEPTAWGRPGSESQQPAFLGYADEDDESFEDDDDLDDDDDEEDDDEYFDDDDEDDYYSDDEDEEEDDDSYFFPDDD